MEDPSQSADQRMSAPERAPGGSGTATNKKSQKGSAGDPPRPRIQKVAVACEECREKKRKCSGARPQCDGCEKRRQQCVYGRFSHKRGYPENIIEILNGRIVELESAQQSNKRHAGLPPEGKPVVEGPDSHHQNFHPPIPFLDRQPASKFAEQEHHGSERYDNKDPQVRTSFGEPSWTADLAPGIPSGDSVHAGGSVPIPTGTLETEKDESGVDAMGAFSSMVIEKGPNSSFFGTSSTISFMTTIQDIMRSFNADSPISINEGVDDPTEQRVSSSTSNNNLALFGSPWRTGGLNPDNEPIDYLIPPRREADALVKHYFETVFILRPYINRAAFQKQYMKLWATDEPGFDKGRASFASDHKPNKDEIERIQFYLTVNLVFALASRLSSSSSPAERILRSERFFQRTQHPRIFQVMNRSSLELVQSLLLMGQYLQSTERSTQCWNVIGFAIRVAQGIGLHLDLPASTNRSQVEVELRRRVWWGCIALDREISMTYGRPIMVHPTMNCGIRLPSIIDDQLLSNSPPRETIPPAAPGICMAFFVYTLKLSNILCEILVLLHSQDYRQQKSSSTPVNDDSTEQYIARPDAQTLLSLDSLLNKWLESLPPYLRISVDGKDPIEDELVHDLDIAMKVGLKRQAAILRGQYLHVKTLLFRPLLLELFYKSHAPLNNSEDIDALNTILQQTMSTSISNICVSIAQQQIENVYMNITVRETQIHAWWYIIYYLYTSAIVVMTGRLCPSIQGLSGEKGLAESWDRALKCLETCCVFSQPAKKGFKVLSMIDEQLFKPQLKNLSEKPLSNTSLGSIPATMEEDETRKHPGGKNMDYGRVTATTLPIQHPGYPIPHKFAGDSNRDGNQNIDLNAEEPEMYSAMDFTWGQEDLSLDWLSSIPFVDHSYDSVYGFDSSNSYM